MPSLIQGRVIYPRIAVPDPQGQNPKEGRPFVILTINEDLKKGGPIYAVGITNIPRDQFDIGQGFIPPRLVDEIADKVELLKSAPRVIRNDPA